MSSPSTPTVAVPALDPLGVSDPPSTAAVHAGVAAAGAAKNDDLQQLQHVTAKRSASDAADTDHDAEGDAAVTTRPGVVAHPQLRTLAEERASAPPPAPASPAATPAADARGPSSEPPRAASSSPHVSIGKRVLCGVFVI